MKKIVSMAAFIVTVCLFAAPAFAAPVAQVAAFPNGEGLEAFLNGMDPAKKAKLIPAKRPEGLAFPVAVVVSPLLQGSHVEIYRAQFDEKNSTVVHKLGDAVECLTRAEPDQSLLFWCHVPEIIPEVVVVVWGKDEEGGPVDHQWSPQFSGEDGSLIMNERFIPFNAAASLKEALINGAPLFSVRHDQYMTLDKLVSLGGEEGPYMDAEHISFTVVDMDGDAAPEVVIELGDRIVLHCEDNTVHAYTFGVREMQWIRKDGSYHGSNGAASGAYLRVKKFHGTSYETETLGEYDEQAGTYTVAGKPVSKEEFNRMTAGDNAGMVKFTRENIAAALKNQITPLEGNGI